MANLTIALDDDLLRQARIRAVEQGTSVNAIVREYLATYAGATSKREAAMKSLIQLSRRSKARRGGKKWSRDELHER
jgi:plasmid stability protein